LVRCRFVAIFPIFPAMAPRLRALVCLRAHLPEVGLVEFLEGARGLPLGDDFEWTIKA
jgi:hypothetical protein